MVLVSSYSLGSAILDPDTFGSIFVFSQDSHKDYPRFTHFSNLIQLEKFELWMKFM